MPALSCALTVRSPDTSTVSALASVSSIQAFASLLTRLVDSAAAADLPPAPYSAEAAEIAALLSVAFSCALLLASTSRLPPALTATSSR